MIEQVYVSALGVFLRVFLGRIKQFSKLLLNVYSETLLAKRCMKCLSAGFECISLSPN